MERNNTAFNEDTDIPTIVSFDKFLKMIGRSRTTGWRWRQNGWIKVVTIAGRPYVRRQDMDEFLARAERGELSTTTTTGPV